jgi:hypothetical protein
VYCVSVASQKSEGRLSNGIRTKNIQKIEREKNRKQKRMHIRKKEQNITDQREKTK